jgi:3-carboxy-cis,cis-muconate cycloisomerase
MPAFPTSTTVLDSILFRDAFGTAEMREVFSDLSLIEFYAAVEIALARAEARCGVIPREAADEIAARTDVAALDFEELRHETDIVGLSDPAAGASDGQTVRRSRPLRALGRDHAGHHG